MPTSIDTRAHRTGVADLIGGYDAELDRSLDAVARELGGLTSVQRIALAREIDALMDRLICAICRRRLWGSET